MKRRRRSPERAKRVEGGAAVVILTVVFLFALVVFTLFSLTRLKPPGVQADDDGTRALMLAHAGIDRAVQELPDAASRAWQGRDAIKGEALPGEPWTFWGEDFNANGALDPGEDVNGNGKLDAVGEPLDEALRPSYAGTVPQLVKVEGRDRGTTGFLSGTHGAQGDQYVVRVTDAASRIWLNGPRERTKAMLSHLAARVGLKPDVASRIVEHVDRALQPRLEEAAKQQRDLTWDEMTVFRNEEELVPLIGVDAWRRLEPYVTALAWVDPDVLDVCPTEKRVRTVRKGDAVYALGDLRPKALSRQPRAPVNVNTAPEEVLAAVFEGVSGLWLDEGARALGASGWGIGYEWMDRPLSYAAPASALGVLRATAPIDAVRADRLARDVAAARRRAPFRTWDDFRRFLDREVREDVIDAMQAEALRANADPNAMLNDFNPDHNAWAPIDKTDLAMGTTEFCFSSMGMFVVESLGRVVDANGRVAARRFLKAHVKAYEVWRETTESEFLSALSAGAEPEVQVSVYDGDGATRRELALEVLPDAAPDAPADRHMIQTLRYDGRIGLATLRSPAGPGTWLRATLTPPLRESLEADDARVSPTWAAEWKRQEEKEDTEEKKARVRAAMADDRPRREREARRPRLEGEPVPGALIQNSDSLDPSAAPAPGRLFPDGAYLERDACLRYRALDNLPLADGQTRSGCVSFWFKPAFDPRRSSRPRTLWSVDRRTLATAPGLVEAPVFGAYLFPSGPDGLVEEGPYRYGFPLRGLVGFGLGQREGPGAWTVAGIGTGRAEFDAVRPHEWVHLAFAWDLDQPKDRAFRMAVNGRLVTASNAFEQQPGSLPLPASVDFDLSQTGVVVRGKEPETTWISFGALGDDPRRNFALDGTVDEIRVGTAASFDDARRDAVEGRYARVSDPAPKHAGIATFESAPRFPGEPAVPGSIAWTVREAPGLPDSSVRLRFYDGRRWSRLFEEPGGQPISEVAESAAKGEFKWRAEFSTGHRPDAACNETPYLDDVTIAYATRPRVLGYSMPPEK